MVARAVSVAPVHGRGSLRGGVCVGRESMYTVVLGACLSLGVMVMVGGCRFDFLVIHIYASHAVCAPPLRLRHH